MKKLLISSVVAVSSLFAITACANVGQATDATSTPTSPAPTMQHHNQGQMQAQMQNMMSELNLTADQRAQMQAIRQNNSGNYTQNHNAMMQILTPEQRQKLTQMRSQHMQQGSRMMNQGGHMMNQDGQMMNQDGRMNQ